MHAVAHDDHPGDTGYTSVLHLLVRVAVPSVRVTVAMRVAVLLGLASVLFGGWLLVLLGVYGCQWRLVCGRVGRLQLRQLRVVVTVVAGDGGAARVCRREKMLRRQLQKQHAVKTAWGYASYLHWGASGAATLHLSDGLTCDLTTSCQSCPPPSPSSCPVSGDIIVRSSHRNSLQIKIDKYQTQGIQQTKATACENYLQIIVKG